MQSKNFPKLTDTPFPDFSTVDPYRFKNEFDYSVWDINTKVQMLNVPWDSAYENTVKFADDTERDTWIDEHASQEFTFETQIAMDPDGTVRLPVPFNTCMKYNYIVITFPEFPVEYGDAERIAKLFYFITDTEKLSVSATKLTLQMDYWTTFINNINISYMMLERGHAPMEAAPAPATFLSNPFANRDLLMADDVDFDDGMSEIIKKQGWNFIFNGSNPRYKSMLIVSKVDLFGEWGVKNTDSMQIPANFFDTDTTVPNYFYAAVDAEHGYNFLSYIVTTYPYIAYSIEAIAFIDKDMLEINAQTESKVIYDITVYKISRSQTITHQSISILSINNFNFDDKYKKITKLYKSPYSKIELTDGKETIYINIESLSESRLRVSENLNLFWPFLQSEMYITKLNVASNSDNINITYCNGLNTLQYTDIFNTDSKHFIFSIPTFAIFADEKNYQQWRRYWSNKQKVNDYTTAWDNTKDSADTAYDNAELSATTAYNNAVASANTALSNATDSATTAYNNATESADTAYNNTTDSATTAYNNAIASADTSYTNATRSADASYDNAADIVEVNKLDVLGNNAVNQYNKNMNINMREQNSIKAAVHTRLSQAAAYMQMDVNQRAGLQGAAMAGLQAVAVGTAGGAIAGGPAGAAIGGLGTLATQTASVLSSAVISQQQLSFTEAINDIDFENRFGPLNHDLDTSTSETYANYSSVYNNWDGTIRSTSAEGQNNNVLNNYDTTNYNSSYTCNAVKNNNNSAIALGGTLRRVKISSSGLAVESASTGTDVTGTEVRNRTTTYSNAGGTKTTAYSNALTSKNTTDLNASRSKTTAYDTALASKNNAIANASATNTTALSNANATKTTSITTASNTHNTTRGIGGSNWTNAENAVTNANEDSFLNVPAEYGSIANVDHVTMRPDGLFTAIKKQSKSAISSAGDQMLRYGYYLHQVWNVANLTIIEQ